MQKVLVVDDDSHIREVVCFALEKAGYQVFEAENGKQALNLFACASPDLLVLDIMMPELDGTEVCREIRKLHNTPIIFLSAKSDDVDMIVGLELGGDDYMTKPFSPRQLVARIKAVLRRTQAPLLTKSNEEGATINSGNLSIDAERFKAYWLHSELVLTATEFKLLEVFAAKPDKVFSRDELIERAYGNVVVSDRTIDSHIRRVRAKIVKVGGDAIKTVHGIGYKLGSCE